MTDDAEPVVRAPLETAFSVQPDAIHAITLGLVRVPPYDGELLAEAFSEGAAGQPITVQLLGIKSDPDRYLLEIHRTAAKVYAIVRQDPHPAIIGAPDLDHGLAHAGLWPGSTISPRLMNQLRQGEHSVDYGVDGELALMSQIARCWLRDEAHALVLNHADFAVKDREQARFELGERESPEQLPFSAWLDVRPEDVGGRPGLATHGFEPFGLPDVSMQLPEGVELESARASLLYACHFMLEHPIEELTHVPDGLRLEEGSRVQLRESSRFVRVALEPTEDRWRLELKFP